MEREEGAYEKKGHPLNKKEHQADKKLIEYVFVPGQEPSQDSVLVWLEGEVAPRRWKFQTEYKLGRPLLDFDFSSKGQFIAASAPNGYLAIGKEALLRFYVNNHTMATYRLPIYLGKNFTSLSWNQDIENEKFLIAGTSNGHILVFRIEGPNPNLLRTEKISDDSIASLQISDDNSTVTGLDRANRPFTLKESEPTAPHNSTRSLSLLALAGLGLGLTAWSLLELSLGGETGVSFLASAPFLMGTWEENQRRANRVIQAGVLNPTDTKLVYLERKRETSSANFPTLVSSDGRLLVVMTPGEAGESTKISLKGFFTRDQKEDQATQSEEVMIPFDILKTFQISGRKINDVTFKYNLFIGLNNGRVHKSSITLIDWISDQNPALHFGDKDIFLNPNPHNKWDTLKVSHNGETLVYAAKRALSIIKTENMSSRIAPFLIQNLYPEYELVEVAVSPDGYWVSAYINDISNQAFIDKTILNGVLRWNLENSEPAQILSDRVAQERGKARSIIGDNEGRVFVFDNTGTLEMWPPSGEQLKTLGKTSSFPLHSPVIHPTLPRKFAAATEDGTVQIYQLEKSEEDKFKTLNPLHSENFNQNQPLRSLSISEANTITGVGGTGEIIHSSIEKPQQKSNSTTIRALWWLAGLGMGLTAWGLLEGVWGASSGVSGMVLSSLPVFSSTSSDSEGESKRKTMVMAPVQDQEDQTERVYLKKTPSHNSNLPTFYSADGKLRVVLKPGERGNLTLLLTSYSKDDLKILKSLTYETDFHFEALSSAYLSTSIGGGYNLFLAYDIGSIDKFPIRLHWDNFNDFHDIMVFPGFAEKHQTEISFRPLFPIKVSHNGKTLLSGNKNIVSVTDTETMTNKIEPINIDKLYPGFTVKHTALSPHGEMVYVDISNLHTSNSDPRNKLLVWDLKNNNSFQEFDYTDPLLNEEYILIGNNNGEALLFGKNWQNSFLHFPSRNIFVSASSERPSSVAAFHPTDSNKFTVATQEGNLEVYSIEGMGNSQNSILRTPLYVEKLDGSSVSSLAFDQNNLITGVTNDGKIFHSAVVETAPKKTTSTNHGPFLTLWWLAGLGMGLTAWGLLEGIWGVQGGVSLAMVGPLAGLFDEDREAEIMEGRLVNGLWETTRREQIHLQTEPEKDFLKAWDPTGH